MRYLSFTCILIPEKLTEVHLEPVSSQILLNIESVLLGTQIHAHFSMLNNHHKVFAPYLYCVNSSIAEKNTIFDQDFGSRGEVCSLLLALNQVVTECSYYR